MSDEDYKDMIMQHDKHIDKLAISIEHIAGAVGSTNRKLEDIIDVISKQNILMEKFSNLEANLKESFGRVHEKIRKIETNQARVAWTVITAVMIAVLSSVIVKAV